MTLHEDPDIYKEAITAASQHFGIREIYIEKDYWATLVLKKIYESEIASYTVFKGGTALSKCHGLIHRFSEDIDLVVRRDEGDSNNKMDRKVKTVSKFIQTILPEVKIEGITNTQGKIRKTAHAYKKKFDGELGQVRSDIIVEVSWLGCSDPSYNMELSSYIYQMMSSNGQGDLITKYEMEPFETTVLSVERTFCEKIMSLVRFSRKEEPITHLQNKVRHMYDLTMLLKTKEIESFVESEEFATMMIVVGQDDLEAFSDSEEWILNHPATAIIFKETEKTWTEISGTYNGAFKELLLGEIPPDDDILETLIRLSHRLKEIKWNIGKEKSEG